MSLRLVSDGVWAEIAELGKSAKVRRAAIAYVTDMASLSFRTGDTLIVDATDDTVACGSTDAKVLAKAVADGAKVYSLSGLHAKLMRLDGTVVVGSANLSPNSRNRLIEAAVISDDEALVAQVDKFIDALEQDATRITEAGVRRLLSIRVNRSSGPNSRRKRTIAVAKGSTWILGLPEIDLDGPEEAVEKEKEAIKKVEGEGSEVDDFYWPKNREFAKAAKEGDLVISIYRPSYANQAPNQIKVYRPTWIRRIIPAGSNPYMGFVTVSPRRTGTERVGWKEFQAMAFAAGIEGLHPNCSIRINDRERRMLNAQWETTRSKQPR